MPTNVYEKDSLILNDVKWSEQLDRVFQENFREDESLSWQYMCSETGPFRIFPGEELMELKGWRGRRRRRRRRRTKKEEEE